MADPTNYSTAWGGNPTLQDLFGQMNSQYLGRANQNKSGELYRGLGASGALVHGTFGIPAQKVGLASLMQMLLQQGRVDPRLLAVAQANNARSTQQQQDAARGGAAASGTSGSGLNKALMAAIGSAGANRSANLNYQDISDSYARQQQNLGLLDQLVIQPQLGYANAGLGSQQNENQLKAAKLGAYASLFGGASKMFGG